MPALPDVPATIRMRLKFTVGSDVDVIPRSYWQYAGTAPTDAQLVTFATAIYTAMVDDIKALCDTTTYFTGVECVDLTSPTAAIGEYSSSTEGTRSGSELPASAAADIAFVIARRYRGGKPRTELPFGTASDLQTAQTWTSAFITAVDDMWAALVTAMNANGWSGFGSLTQVNVSYYGPPNRLVTSSGGRVRTVSSVRGSGGSPPAAPIIPPDVVTSYGCQTRLGTVRRRLGKSA